MSTHNIHFQDKISDLELSQINICNYVKKKSRDSRMSSNYRNNFKYWDR